MPVAVVRTQASLSGVAELVVMEYVPGVDYSKFLNFLDISKNPPNTACTSSLLKDKPKELLLLARGDRERELVRVAVFQASGLLYTAARRKYGFQDIPIRVENLQRYSLQLHYVCTRLSNYTPISVCCPCN